MAGFAIIKNRGVAQPGSVLAWGASGRRFKSSRPDQSVLEVNHLSLNLVDLAWEEMVIYKSLLSCIFHLRSLLKREGVPAFTYSISGIN